jgi:hypothetical protein
VRGATLKKASGHALSMTRTAKVYSMNQNKPSVRRVRHPVAARVTSRELEMLDRYREIVSEQRGGEPISRACAVRALIRFVASVATKDGAL